MIKRIESDEIPFIRLQAYFQGQTQTVSTNEEGYFEVSFDIDPSQLNPDHHWHTISFELLDKVLENQTKVGAAGEVMIPSSEAEFGVIWMWMIQCSSPIAQTLSE
jgi:phosphatidate phosphatase APP1